MTFGWNYPPGVTGMEREIQGGWPPCATCGHDHEDHIPTAVFGTRELQMLCHATDECSCVEYIELDEEEYRLRQYERKHNL